MGRIEANPMAKDNHAKANEEQIKRNKEYVEAARARQAAAKAKADTTSQATEAKEEKNK